jgi:hypothetical protein
MLKAIRTDDGEKDNCRKVLKHHHDSQTREWKKAMHHREKALKYPGRYMCIMINGMDQKKHVCQILLEL